MYFVVRTGKTSQLSFDGICIADVVALNHDDTVRRLFRLYQTDQCYVAERIDNPATIDVRYWGSVCGNSQSVYEFFGNEPLANYLYGTAGLAVPGLHSNNR